MDDIRDRFRGVKRDRSVPHSSGRPERPVRPALTPTPTPSVKTAIRPAPRPQPMTPVQSPNLPKKYKNRRKRSKKLLFGVLLLLLLVALGVGSYALYKKNTQKPTSGHSKIQPAQTTQPAQQTKPTGTIRFIATGSNLASESITTSAKKPDGGYNYLPMMAELKPLYDKSDIRLCHETNPGGGDKNGLAISGYPTLNAPIEWSTGFASLGCNLMGLASDHINDKGQTAIDATLSTLEIQKTILGVAGANRSADEQAAVRYFSVKQVKFAFVAYTTSSANKQLSPFSVNLYSNDLANKQIAEAHKNAQLVIVSMNWGTEGNSDISAEQDAIATNLANQNVDVIVGVGPHVLQSAKILTGKDGHQTLAWFSLGNFLNSELPVNNLIGGMAIMDFDVATQKLSNPALMPIYMHYEWTAPQKAAGTVNARHDFKLVPLDQAAPLLAKSQNGTTVEAQTSRVTGIITKFAPIKVIKSTEF